MSDGRRSASAPPPVARMVDSTAPEQPFVTSPSRWSRIRPSGWEIALWLFGIVLVIAAIQANVTAIESQYFPGSARSCVEEACLIYTQSVVMLPPGALAAGLITIALALAIRALKSRGLSTTLATAQPSTASAPAGTHAAAPTQTPAPAPADQPTPAFPTAPPTFLTPPVPTAPGATRATRSTADGAPSAGGGPITPASQPDRVSPVPVVPTRGALPSRPPAAAPRRRADVDHSIYMRPSTPATITGAQPTLHSGDGTPQDR